MPSPVRFAEVRRLLESHGFAWVRTTGSHHIFEKQGEKPISLPVHHGKVKYGYVRRIQKAFQAD